MNVGTAEFEADCLPFHTAFNILIDNILAINVEELYFLGEEVEDHQRHLLNKIQESRIV